MDNWHIRELKLQFKNRTILLTSLARTQPHVFSARLPANSLQRNISENLVLFTSIGGPYGSERVLLTPGIEQDNI